MKKVGLFVFTIWASWLSNAYANDAGRPICKYDGTQSEMTLCAMQDHENADLKLNMAYRKKISSLNKTQQKKLRQEHHIWLKHIQNDCKSEANDEAEGGSMWPMIFHQCLADHIEQRTRELSEAARK
ncbi:MAG: lysozyme inhibitor LprI family protein [Alphaproteobacteria bacterium]|jgi:uncharacterized protein YecT (DUF1311 family)